MVHSGREEERRRAVGGGARAKRWTRRMQVLHRFPLPQLRRWGSSISRPCTARPTSRRRVSAGVHSSPPTPETTSPSPTHSAALSAAGCEATRRGTHRAEAALPAAGHQPVAVPPAPQHQQDGGGAGADGANRGRGGHHRPPAAAARQPGAEPLALHPRGRVQRRILFVGSSHCRPGLKKLRQAQFKDRHAAGRR